MFGDKNFIGKLHQNEDGTQSFKWKSFREVYADTLRLTSVFRQNRVGEPIELDKDMWRIVGIYSENRTEWVETELACIGDSITIVPIF